MATSRTNSRPYVANSPFNAGREAARVPLMSVEVGEQVCHERHGLGRVIAFDGNSAVIVDFGRGERRRVALDSSRIERL